jgi:hypothetical protein
MRHDRPVLTPIVYGLGTFSVGLLSYTAFYLLTSSIKVSLGALLSMDAVFVLYLLEDRRTAKE